MNANQVETNNLTEELRARVPSWMKTAVSTLATDRVLDDADILREAVAEYLESRGKRQPEKNQLKLGLVAEGKAAA